MCGLYGILSYGNKVRDIEEITQSLAFESAVRGTDATGIAYNDKGKITIMKKSKSAYEMDIKVPKNVSVVMGHTRHATQGTIKHNANNHPFSGKVGCTRFALAHNGILCNDTDLRKQLHLPSTRIETDSYIAVQLLGSKRTLNFDSIKYMAEKVQGSFSFTILDDRNNLYFVKGDSPIELLHFPKQCVYVYASTKEILWKAVVDTELFKALQAGEYEEIIINDGELLRISASGQLKQDKFNFDEYAAFGYDWRLGFRSTSYEKGYDYIDDIKSVAPYYGYDSDDVDDLLSQGYSAAEIEEILYDGEYARV